MALGKELFRAGVCGGGEGGALVWKSRASEPREAVVVVSGSGSLLQQRSLPRGVSRALHGAARAMGAVCQGGVRCPSTVPKNKRERWPRVAPPHDVTILLLVECHGYHFALVHL